MVSFEKVTVLTTEERSDWYKAVFGLDAHYVFDPSKTEPLAAYLSNLRIGRGSLVVLDEAHFLSADMLLMGVKSYVDDPRNAESKMRLVVVCSGRRPGDRLLAYLTMYCHVFDIICADDCIELADQLEHLVRTPNKRGDILEYMSSEVQVQNALRMVSNGGMDTGGIARSIEVPIGMRVKLVIEPVGV